MPPELRAKSGLDRLDNPMLLVEERDGKLILVPTTAIPVRDIPEAKLRSWIAEDEKAMKDFETAGRSKRKQ